MSRKKPTLRVVGSDLKGVENDEVTQYETAAEAIARSKARHTFLASAHCRMDSLPDLSLFTLHGDNRVGDVQLPDGRRISSSDRIGYPDQPAMESYNDIAAQFARFGPFRSIGHLAVKLLKHAQPDTRLPTSDWTTHTHMRRFYFGGRIQLFERGLFNKVSIYDENAAYPWILRTHLIPLVNRVTWTTAPLNDYSYYVVKCQSDQALPVWIKDRVAYPSDTMQYWVPGVELHRALEMGKVHKHKILRAVAFTGLLDLTRLANYLYALAADAVGWAKKLLKLCQIAVYGKLGANPAKYRTFQVLPRSISEDAEIEPPWRRSMMLDDGRLVVSRPRLPEECHYHDVAAAAYITACQRAVILDQLTSARLNGARPIQVLTDSIAVEGDWHPPLGNDAGDWKVEDEGPAAFDQPGVYWVGTRVRSAGFRLSRDEITRRARNKKARLFTDKYPSWVTM